MPAPPPPLLTLLTPLLTLIRLVPLEGRSHFADEPLDAEDVPLLDGRLDAVDDTDAEDKALWWPTDLDWWQSVDD